MKILLFSGSVRAASLNLRLVNLAHRVVLNLGHDATLVNLGDLALPIYHGDDEDRDGLPENVLRLKQLIADTDALVISTPEYNGFFPGLLKNALDWASRAGGGLDGRATYEGKKTIVMAAATGAGAGNRVLPRLADQMQILRTTVVDQIGIGKAEDTLDSPETEARLKQAIGRLSET